MTRYHPTCTCHSVPCVTVTTPRRRGEWLTTGQWLLWNYYRYRRQWSAYPCHKATWSGAEERKEGYERERERKKQHGPGLLVQARRICTHMRMGLLTFSLGQLRPFRNLLLWLTTKKKKENKRRGGPGGSWRRLLSSVWIPPGPHSELLLLPSSFFSVCLLYLFPGFYHTLSSSSHSLFWLKACLLAAASPLCSVRLLMWISISLGTSGADVRRPSCTALAAARKTCFLSMPALRLRAASFSSFLLALPASSSDRSD